MDLIYRQLVGHLKLFYRNLTKHDNRISIKSSMVTNCMEPIFTSMVCSSEHKYGRISLAWWEWKILRFPDAGGLAWIPKAKGILWLRVLMPVPGNKFRCCWLPLWNSDSLILSSRFWTKHYHPIPWFLVQDHAVYRNLKYRRWVEGNMNYLEASVFEIWNH